ncbi:hypothetical protein [Vibrio vulnificus YJ016]|uniref:Uncharacterized protein n=1 Tax=Vibrio vulnificus (strain YJ016) TaxID=196600 RepID=Q7MG48_VIBVY|nr:hypothetical protein [Vibrio vulnificus YJ016]
MLFEKLTPREIFITVKVFMIAWLSYTELNIIVSLRIHKYTQYHKLTD